MLSVPSATTEEGSETLNNVSGDNGGGSGLFVSPSESSDNNANLRQVWNRPANVAPEIPLVMGADSWPSLSEAANAPQRPSSDISRAVSEGSVSIFNQASSSRNGAGHGVRSNSTQNGTHPGRYRSTRNHATRSSVGNGDRSQQHQLPSSQGPVSEASSNNGSHNNNSNLDSSQNNGPRSLLHSGGNHPPHRDSHRRSNGGPSSRGDGSNGRRRNVDREANPHHSSNNARTGPMQPPVFPGPFPSHLPRPALPVAPYPPPPFPALPFMPPGVHPITGEYIIYRPPLMPPLAIRPHPVYFPSPTQLFIADLMRQIDYYFSDENLVKDVHLRQNMDGQGWVLVTIIAKFNKVNELIAQNKHFLDNKDIDALQFILNVMQNSPFVEVKDDKLRKRFDWEKYILPNIVESSSTTIDITANGELAAAVENTKLEEPICSNSKLEVDDAATDEQAVE